MEPSGLTDVLMQGLIYLALIALTIYGLILGYHWYSYGTSKRASTIALLVFVGGGLFFVGTMFISYLAY